MEYESFYWKEHIIYTNKKKEKEIFYFNLFWQYYRSLLMSNAMWKSISKIRTLCPIMYGDNAKANHNKDHNRRRKCNFMSFNFKREQYLSSLPLGDNQN